MMSQKLKDYEVQILNLPVEERALLAEHLISSLDSVNDSENERLWVKEAETRYQQYKNGEISARPAIDVLHDVRSKIK